MSAETSRRYALDARQGKRATACAVGIDEPFIADLVDRFYDKVRSDEALGPIFGSSISDWPAHLDKMKRFWRSVLHNSGEFSGSPMRKHAAIAGLDEGHFHRWLTLFYQTLRDIEPTAEATAQVGAKARLIAESLLTGIAIQDGGIAHANIGKELPHV